MLGNEEIQKDEQYSYKDFHKVSNRRDSESDLPFFRRPFFLSGPLFIPLPDYKCSFTSKRACYTAGSST